MAKRHQHAGLNSSEKISSLFAEVNDLVPVPAGVILRTDDDVRIWRQFTQARPASGWREVDLVMLAKAVRLESDLAKFQKQLDDTGALIENDKGEFKPNPLIQIIDIFHRQQLSILRMLSICILPQAPKYLNAQAVKQSSMRALKDNMSDLISR